MRKYQGCQQNTKNPFRKKYKVSTFNENGAYTTANRIIPILKQ